MVRTMLGRCCVLVVSLGLPGSAPAGNQDRDLASEVLEVFSAKCAACHGPNVGKPRGGFGYVLNLGRVAGNREMVVPFAPDQSELWEHVSKGEMPPPDSPTGPLSSAQKEVIHAWIAAGAPTAASPGSAVIPAPEPQPQRDVPPVSAPVHVARMLGSLHVVIVHFPIGLLIAAAVGEFWSGWQGSRTPTQHVRFCVLLGSAGALAAAALGWLHAANGHGAGMPQILGMHRWVGTAAAVWSLGIVLLGEWDERRGVRSLWFRVFLFIGALLVGASGHLGGVLVHGEDFFTQG
jgi:mono/diheme cytochrome c family protein/uncharacterized membrane protein